MYGLYCGIGGTTVDTGLDGTGLPPATMPFCPKYAGMYAPFTFMLILGVAPAEGAYPTGNGIIPLGAGEGATMVLPGGNTA